MTTTAFEIIASKQVENAQTTQYTAAAKTIIDKFTVTNTTAGVVNFSANLVNAAGAAGASNLIISVKAIAPGEAFTCPALVGHVLEVGDFISTLASAATSLTMRASGRRIT